MGICEASQETPRRRSAGVTWRGSRGAALAGRDTAPGLSLAEVRAALEESGQVDIRHLLCIEKGAKRLSHWWLNHGIS